VRPIPARRALPKEAKIKGTISQIIRLDAPVKGLSLVGKSSIGDPQTATILTNFVCHEDHVLIRPGNKLIKDHYAGVTPKHAIVNLMPYLAEPQHMIAATDGKLVGALTGTLLQGGFASNDWHWTMFANLSQQKFLVACNGADGVWSYDGQSTADIGAVSGTVAGGAGANPAVVTVAAGDITKFQSGKNVQISGATGSFAAANGIKVIGTVGATTFTLLGVDLTGATGTQPITANPFGSWAKEPISLGANMPYCNPDTFAVVLAHINRLYFADRSTLAVYYLPLQSKSGTLAQIPMNAVFRKGGFIVAMASWTVDAGAGMDDKLCVFTSNGECAIYSGIDPEDDAFGLLGVYRFDAPMSKWSIVNYAGDVWVLTGNGLAPMTTLMRAETEKLAKAEKGIITEFQDISNRYRALPGWYAILNNSYGRIICNMPLGSTGNYQQMVRQMPDPIWSKWKEIPARCWCWIDNKMYFGTDSGEVREHSFDYLADYLRPNPANPTGPLLSDPINAEVRGAWANYKTPGVKHFKLVRVYARTTGAAVRPYVDMAVNFVDRRPENQPEVILPAPPTPWGAPWGSAWGSGWRPAMSWNGVGRLGNVGAPYVKVAVNGARYELMGFDVVYEQGIVV
jgi:hypothetical protein